VKMKPEQSAMLVTHREAKGWTQAEAASITGVPAHVIGYLEREGGARSNRVRQLVDGLGIDPVIFYNLEAAK